MAKKTEKIEPINDPLQEAKNAKHAYVQMKQSIKFFHDMLDYHIKHAEQVIKKHEKLEEDALASQTEIFTENK